MASAQGIRAGAAYVELYTKDNRLVRGLNAAAKKLKAFGAGLMAVGTQMAGLGLMLVTPFLGAAKIFADMGSDMLDMSQRTGVSVEALSELGFAAEQSGADVETLEAGLRKMQQTVTAAGDGSQQAQEALGKLGLTVGELAKLSPDEQFKRIADRLSQIENPALRTALAMEVFGKSGTKLLPMMAEGAKGIEALQEKARKLGLTMSTEDAQAAEEFGDTVDVLWKVLKKAAFTVGAALAPSLTDLVEWITQAVVSVIEWIKENKDLVVTVFQLAAAILAGGTALIVIGGVISGIGAAFGALVTVITAVGTAIGVIGSIIGTIGLPLTIVIAAVAALGAYLLYTTDAGSDALSWLGEQFDALKETAVAAWKGISDALAAGDLGLAAKIVWLTLKMEWQKGLLWLEGKWLDFKFFFVDVFDQAVYAVARFLNDTFAGIDEAWAETTTFMSQAWDLLISELEQTWNEFAGFFQKAWARIKGLVTDEDSDAEVARIDKETAQENRRVQSRSDSAIWEQEKALQEKRQQIERDRSGTEDELRRMQDEDARDRERRKQEQLQESRDAIAQAKKEWEDALAEAAQKRAAKEENDAKGPKKMKPAEELDGLDQVIDTTQKKIDVQGSFNALAVRGLGSDSLAERTAKATEQMADNTKRLLQEAQHGGLTFA